MSHKYYFLGGLPRAGSTLLTALLNQNPNFYASPTSGLMDICFTVRNQWNNQHEHKAIPCDERQTRVLKGIINSYYEEIDKPIIFDKCRGWLSWIEPLEHILEQKVKIIVPVRDIRDVLSSFELLWRKQSKHGQVPGEKENYIQFQTLQGRLDFWSRSDQLVGIAYSRIKDAFARGLKDRLHLVPFEKLTTQPEITMRGIYEVLGEPYFQHQYDNVENPHKENDREFGWDDLHTVRSKVEPIPPRWPDVLGSLGDKYKNDNFWSNLV